MSHREGPGGEEQQLTNWSTSVGIALGGTVAAIALILLFTYLVDWVGDFWSQVAYAAGYFFERAKRGWRVDTPPSRP